MNVALGSQLNLLNGYMTAIMETVEALLKV
jgi:hypothetical protein